MSCELDKPPAFRSCVATSRYGEWDARGSRQSDTGSEDAVITWAADESYNGQLSKHQGTQGSNLHTSRPVATQPRTERKEQSDFERKEQSEFGPRPGTQRSNHEEAARPSTPLRQSDFSASADRIERLQTPLTIQNRPPSSRERAASGSWSGAAVVASRSPSYIDQQTAPLVAPLRHSNASPGEQDEDIADGAQSPLQQPLDLSPGGSVSSLASPSVLQARLFLACKLLGASMHTYAIDLPVPSSIGKPPLDVCRSISNVKQKSHNSYF